MSQREREIWEACDDLLALGVKPIQITMERIGHRLRELGYKAGSLTYRSKYRDSWMAARNISREDDEVRASNKPTDIIERSAALFSKAIEEELRKEYETKYQETEVRIEALTQSVIEKEAIIEQLTQENKTLTREKKTLQESLKSTETNLEGLRKQMLIVETLATEYHQQLNESKAYHQQQLKHYETDYDKKYQFAVNQFNEREKQYDKTEALLKEHNEKVRHHFMVEIDNLRTENQKLQQIIQQGIEKEHQLQTQLTLKTTELADCENNCQQLRQKQAALTLELKEYQQQVIALKIETTLLETLHEVFQQQQNDMQQQLEPLRSMLVKLQKTFTSKKGKK